MAARYNPSTEHRKRRHVSDPHLVRLRRGEVSVEQIRRDAFGEATLCRASVGASPSRDGPVPVLEEGTRHEALNFT